MQGRKGATNGWPLWLCAALWALTPAVVVAQATRPSLEMARAATRPSIDGKLDDPCWKDAPVIKDFTQVIPVAGDKPTEKTEVRLLYDRDAIYIAIRCYDSQPDRIISRQMQRDADLGSDDMVKIAFDTFGRRRDGYYFSTNPAGARVEGLIEDFADQNKLWDTIWDVEARIDDQGWTAEAAIPVKSLSFDPAATAWGCNIERTIRRKQEVARWTAISPAKPMTSLADFGELRGIAGLRHGLGLEVKPFLTYKYTDDENFTDWSLKPGSDFIYRITPSLTAQASINTDFAEADVDDRVVNLTRFPVFFPEKRDFFLQDASLFAFGGIGTSPLPYYSRRIGLDAGGRPVDVLFGGRLTGRIGDTSLALLTVEQDESDDLPAKNLSVIRIAQQVLDESNVGVILTHGDPRSDGDNTLAGVDFNYLNTRLDGGRRLMGHAYFMGTDSDNFDAQDYAWGLALAYPNEPWDLFAEVEEAGDEFDPAMGFIGRRGVREYRGWIRHVWRINHAWIRSISLRFRPEVITEADGRIVAEDYDLPGISLLTPAGDSVYAEWFSSRDVLDESFEIWPDVMLPADDYRWSGYLLELHTSSSRPISLDVEHRAGTFYNGTRNDYGAGFSVRPSRHLNLGLFYELRDIDLEQGDFDVRLVSGRVNFAFSPSLSWTNVAQYDNKSRSVGFDSRVRWTVRPGNDLFIAVSQGYDFDDWRLHESSSQLIVKAGLSFRF